MPVEAGNYLNGAMTLTRESIPMANTNGRKKNTLQTSNNRKNKS